MYEIEGSRWRAARSFRTCIDSSIVSQRAESKAQWMKLSFISGFPRMTRIQSFTG